MSVLFVLAHDWHRDQVPAREGEELLGMLAEAGLVELAETRTAEHQGPPPRAAPGPAREAQIREFAAAGERLAAQALAGRRGGG